MPRNPGTIRPRLEQEKGIGTGGEGKNIEIGTGKDERDNCQTEGT